MVGSGKVITDPDPEDPKTYGSGTLVTAYIKVSMHCMYCIQHCFICRPSDSTVSDVAGIEPRTVATSALAVSALTTRLDLIHIEKQKSPCYIKVITV
jgi:hypothetical protein